MVMGAQETLSGAWGSRTFTSDDMHVGETANAIEKRFPGRIKAVNKDVYRNDGSKLTDFDIELVDNVVVQVKTDNARGLEGQIIRTSNEMKQIGMHQEVIGYAPGLDLSFKAVRIRIANAEKQGIAIFTTLDDLLNYFSSKY